MRKYGYLILAVVLVAPAAFAATSVSSTNTDNVTASVANNCKINTFALAFGPYDGVVANAAADLDTSAAVSVFCTKGTAPTSITMGAGANASGATRRMTNGTDFLTYEIFLNSTRTTIWNTSNVIVPNASTSKNTALTFNDGTNATATITAFGRVFQNQDVTSGNYKDTVQATVNF